jgi:hypothetical protein
VEETKVVVRAEPFQFTFDVETKFVPLTVRVNWALPAVVELGLIEVVVGTGLLIVNVCAFDVPPGPPPPGGFTTVTCAVPLVATSVLGTTAVSCVEETKVVARAEPFQFTFDVEMKFVPFTVRVNWVLPAVVELGLIPVVVGTAASALLAAANTTRNGRSFFIGRS